MTDRDRKALAGFVDFGRVITSALSSERNTVRITIEGIPGLELPEQEMWGNAAVLMRPDDADADGRSAEVMFFRMEDELVAFASRDTRWQVTLEKGEVCLRALGASAAQIRLKPDGTVKLGSDAATDDVALAPKVHEAISAMLAAGIGATGTDAFIAAKASWDTAMGTSESAPPSSVAATKVKAE